MELTVIHHPLVASRLSVLRDQRSDNATFFRVATELSTMLIYEASRNLATASYELHTPLAETVGTRIDNPPVIVPIMRAGLAMVDPALAMIPEAHVAFLGLARNEQTHQPVVYLDGLPADLTGQSVFLVDPMLATGGSLLHALDLLAKRGATDITVVCVIAAQTGVDAVEQSGHVSRLIVAAIDEELNDDAYIVPGLGDAGDRLYGPRNLDV